MNTTNVWRKSSTFIHSFMQQYLLSYYVHGYKHWEYSREKEKGKKNTVLPIMNIIICCEETDNGHNK